MSTYYPPEILDDEDDDGTIVENVETLADQVVGHRIVKAERTAVKPSEFKTLSGYDFSSWKRNVEGLVLTLDNGRRVLLEDSSDCCAYTELEAFLLHPDKVDHIITGVGTTDGYEKWHIYADMGDVLELSVGWSCGNPFYYGYGFEIAVSDVIEEDSARELG